MDMEGDCNAVDDPNLKIAREHLAKFERCKGEHIGLKELDYGLALLYDLSRETNDEDTATTCGSYVRTYQTMIEKEATRLLKNKDSIGAEELFHWYKIMEVFEESGFPFSDGFHSLWQELQREERVFERVFEKLFKEASPSIQQDIRKLLNL